MHELAQRPLVAASRLSESLIFGCLNDRYWQERTINRTVPKSGRGVAAIPREAAVAIN